MDEMDKYYTVRGYELMQQDSNPLTSAMEDYLEMIYRNSIEAGLLRSSILSALLNVNPSSVTKMLQKLSRLGYVDYQKYGIIFLTEKGKKAGAFLYRRHQTLERFLSLIGDNNDSTLVETELIEHHISPKTLSNIEIFHKFIDANPDILERFSSFKENIADNSPGVTVDM